MNIDKIIEIKCGGEVFVDIEELHFFQNKLKYIKEDKFKDLKASLVKSGLPLAFHIWIDGKNKKWIVDGHHRFLALKALKSEGYFIAPIPCNIVKASNRKEAAQIVLISNSRYAQINEESLAEFMIDFELQLPDLELLDFPDIDLDNFKLDSEEKEGLCDPDEVPEHVEPKAKLGDIYKLGEHRLMCGDSTSIDDVESLMNGEKADITFTSPPYNANESLEYNDGKKRFMYADKKSDNKSSQEYLDFLNSIFDVVFQYSTSEVNVFFNINYNANSEQEYILCLAKLLTRGWNLRETIVWKKTGMPSGGYHATRVWEFVFLLTKHRDKYFQLKNDSERLFNFWEISNIGAQHESHRACFPVSLPETAIVRYSPLEGKVLEPFGGSGSTLIACEKTKRKCFMMELDPHYIDVIIARWEKYTGKKAELLNNLELQ